MITLENINVRPNLKSAFSYRQIGSLTREVEPIDVSASVESVMDFFQNNPTHTALPIERNGALLGILGRSDIERLSESAWARFWQKELDAYIQAPLVSLRADDYIEKNVERVLELNTEKGARHFAVFYRKSFFGIVDLQDMLARITEMRAQEMEKARQVQKNLLESSNCPKDGRYSLIAWNRMASEVGGDFYKDFCLDGGSRRVIGCFDVSGKNLAASLSTMAVGAFFSALKHFDLGGKFGQELTRRLDGFVDDLTPPDTFITAALLYVDLGEGTLTIQNCGHTPIYLFIPGEDRRVVGKTMPANMAPLGMGVVSSEENTAYRVPISRGLRVVSYTDGLTDMVDPDGERYGDDRARDLIAGTYGKSEAETRAAFSKAIDGWGSDALQADDITILDLRFL